MKITVIYSSRKIRLVLLDTNTFSDLEMLVRSQIPEIAPKKFSFKLSPINGKINKKELIGNILNNGLNKFDTDSVHWQNIYHTKNNLNSKVSIVQKDSITNHYLVYMEVENPHSKKRNCVVM